MSHRFPIFIIAILLLSACQSGQGQKGAFSVAEEKGKINKKFINEASGIDASIINPGFLWTHNDSGGKAEIYLIDSLGQYVGKATLSGAKNRDWEEIAVAQHPDSARAFVYVGEIGDNRGVYATKFIYRFAEPKLNQKDELVITQFDTIAFVLEDGPRDTEAFFVDDATQNIYVFSKREPNINVYVLPYPQATQSVQTANKIATLPLTQIVAADYRAASGELLIKNYESVYYWKKQTTESWDSLFTKTVIKLPYVPEPQGEAICFSFDGKGYYTLSEEAQGEKPALLFYKRN